MHAKAALVIGGSSGMGKAMARVLVQEGYAVTVCGRDRERLDGAVAELRAEAGAGDPPVQGVAADAAGEQGIVELIDAHRRAYGRLDVLVNSAGGGGGAGGGPIGDLAPEAWDRTVALNLRSAYLSVHHALDLLRTAGAEHGKALVVNVGSAAGKEGTPGMSAYSAAKAGLRTLTEAGQAENRHDGVQFTTFVPGFVATPMATWAVAMGIGVEEMVAPEDLGEGLRFLLRTSHRCFVREIEFMPADQPSILTRVRAARRSGSG